MLGDCFLMFDPFENRISRDIRNQLSESFLFALREQSPDPVEKTGKALKQIASGPDHINYIDDRLRRYNMILNQLGATKSNTPQQADPFETARLLWNLKLFFECHEWLEYFWIKASGSEKKIIQGLIRASGAFVLLEAGRKPAAKSSAQKAIALLREYKESIPGIFNADELIQTLKNHLRN